jgi:hypothetical protein
MIAIRTIERGAASSRMVVVVGVELSWCCLSHSNIKDKMGLIVYNGPSQRR